MPRSAARIAFVCTTALATLPAAALSIHFDYTYDTSGFFNDPARRALLQTAADSLPIADALTAIHPAAGDSWDATFINPSTGAPASVHDLDVPDRTLTIFVGARPLPTGVPGDAAPGSFAAATGSPAFLSALATRGQSGATPDPATSTDFGPWGGSISFNASADWYVGTFDTGLTPGQTDFASAAMHALFHVLGFGAAPSFQHYVSNSTFTGPVAEHHYYLPADNPQDPPTPDHPIPLTPDLAHWDPAAPALYAAMTPALPPGTRRIPGPLDYAALRDVGWDTAIPGEFPDPYNEGVVDLTDLNNVLNNLGTFNPVGDYTVDGIVDLSDLNLILNNFGTPYAPTTLSPVPEPASSLACLLTTLPLLARRRRQP